MLTKYLSVLLHSGLAMDDALSIIADQSRRGPLKRLWRSSYKAFVAAKHSHRVLGNFRRYSVPSTSILSEREKHRELCNAIWITWQNRFKKNTRCGKKCAEALMYPAIILVGAVILSVGIVVFILPNITDVFRTLDVELPWTTRALLWLAELFEQHGETGRARVCSVRHRCSGRAENQTPPTVSPSRVALIPIVGRIMRNTNLARFARVTGTMLNSGSTISDILPIATSVPQKCAIPTPTHAYGARGSTRTVARLVHANA